MAQSAIGPKGLKTQYEIELFRKDSGTSLGRRPVPVDHLERCREWLLFQAQRRGAVPPDANGHLVFDRPHFGGEHPGQISGILMSVGRGPARVEQTFSLHTLQSVADDFLLQLVLAGQVDQQTAVLYRAYAATVPDSHGDGGVVAKVRRAALPVQEGRLDDWLCRATVCGTLAEDDCPLLVEQAVIPQSLGRSWAGRDMEGGAWLVGNLYCQRDPPEIFGVIHTVLQACGMTQEKDRLDLSTQTYQNLAEQLERRRVRMGRVGELAIGFIHSHPFLPSEVDGHDGCSGCEKRTTCTTTSAFLSKRDAQFHAALFGAAPYAVQMVLGLTPREEFDLRMFCLAGGRFRERGFHALAAQERPENDLEVGSNVGQVANLP